MPPTRVRPLEVTREASSCSRGYPSFASHDPLTLRYDLTSFWALFRPQHLIRAGPAVMSIEVRVGRLEGPSFASMGAHHLPEQGNLHASMREFSLVVDCRLVKSVHQTMR